MGESEPDIYPVLSTLPDSYPVGNVLKMHQVRACVGYISHCKIFQCKAAGDRREGR